MGTEKNSEHDGLSLEVLEAELRQMPQPAVPAELEGRLLADIPAGKRASRLWYRGLLVRTAAAAAILIAVVGLFAWLTGGNGTASVSFAQVLQPISGERPFTYKQIVQREGLTPSFFHYIRLDGDRARRTASDGSFWIADWHKKKTLIVNPATKTATIYIVLSPSADPVPEIIEEVKTFQVGEEEDLGVREIDGRSAVGFRVRKRNQDFDVWADARTGLPIRIEAEIVSGRTGVKTKVTVTDIEFDVQLDENLFSLEPPEGYKTIEHTRPLLRYRIKPRGDD